MDKLTVHTLTDGRNRGWLRESIESVRVNLPAGSFHVVSELTDYQYDIWAGYRYNDYYAAVDADDLVINDSLNLCIRALQETGAGIAFTYEGQIDENGDDLGVNHRAVTYCQIACHPRSLHHLAVFRTECVDDRVWELARGFGFGIDWMTKAWVALNHGAVQVPVVGYKWRRHRSGMSHLEEPKFREHMPEIRRIMCSWLGDNPGMVPQYAV